MLILSQDKNVIINFNKALSIWIENPLNNDNSKFSIEVSADIDENLGYYATEKRAKEVLREIIEMYIDCNEQFDSSGLGYIRNKVYEMPEK